MSIFCKFIFVINLVFPLNLISQVTKDFTFVAIDSSERNYIINTIDNLNGRKAVIIVEKNNKNYRNIKCRNYGTNFKLT